MTKFGSIEIRPITTADRVWIRQILTFHWDSPQVVSRGVLHNADRLPGFIAVRQDAPSGLVTYHLTSDECEIVTLDSQVEGIGIGTALIDAVTHVAQAAGCHRLWVITTNDNIPAFRFYQTRGFYLVSVYPNAVQASRVIKPGIPEKGIDGIPIRDEIEFEMVFHSDHNLHKGTNK